MDELKDLLKAYRRAFVAHAFAYYNEPERDLRPLEAEIERVEREIEALFSLTVSQRENQVTS